MTPAGQVTPKGQMTAKPIDGKAKYLYDISKGVALVAVIGNVVKDQWNISNLLIGLLAAIGFFIWGYVIDGGSDNE